VSAEGKAQVEEFMGNSDDGFSAFWERGIRAQDANQRLPVIFGGANLAVFPLSHRPHGNPGFCSHFRLRKIGFDAFQQ
jgi:hypothetical protein